MSGAKSVKSKTESAALIVKEFREELVDAEDITPDFLRNLKERTSWTGLDLDLRVLMKEDSRYYPFLNVIVETSHSGIYRIEGEVLRYGGHNIPIGELNQIMLDFLVISLEIYSDPLKALENDLILFTRIVFTNPLLWSSPHVTGQEFSERFSRVSSFLLDRYLSFIRSITLLTTVERVPILVNASKFLASLGIDPPVTRSDFLLFVELNPIEAKVLKALSAKKALDLTMIGPEESAILLLKLLRSSDPKGYKRRRLQKSLTRREETVGLTLTEMSILLDVDRAYLWRKVLPNMVIRGLLFRWTFKRGDRDVIVYEANSTIPLVADLVTSYQIELGLRRMGVSRVTDL